MWFFTPKRFDAKWVKNHIRLWWGLRLGGWRRILESVSAVLLKM